MKSVMSRRRHPPPPPSHCSSFSSLSYFPSLSFAAAIWQKRFLLLMRYLFINIFINYLNEIFFLKKTVFSHVGNPKHDIVYLNLNF